MDFEKKEESNQFENVSEDGGSQKVVEQSEERQEKIAQEYLREYENHQKLMQSHNLALKSLDSAREESILTTADTSDLIKKLEEERAKLSKLVDESLQRMQALFNQLTDESKDKYLKS